MDETLNRGKSRTQFLNEFIIDTKSVTDHKEMANKFNIFFANIGAKLSSGNDRQTMINPFLTILATRRSIVSISLLLTNQMF